MCGIVGITGSPDAAKEAYFGLLKLQHRGQDAAGILTYDLHAHRFSLLKKSGLVSQVFDEKNIQDLSGEMAIAHTRYQTVGTDHADNIQPLVVNYPYGLGMAHNGNIVNYYELVENLRLEKKRLSLTNNDLEVLQHILSDSLAEKGKEFHKDNLFAAIKEVFDMAKGGYSVIGMVAEEGMFGFRDPSGIRPLILGKRGKAYCLASESNALRFLDYEIVRDINPGEAIFISRDGELTSHQGPQVGIKPCMFEWVYFSNPESTIENQSVYSVRARLGQLLAEKIKGLINDIGIAPDIVVPVPETSRIAATALAENLKIPYKEVLIKNRYIHRSFILKTQEQRKNAVELKLSPVESEIRGKKVLLLDDSIVRGTTSIRLINLMRKAGAKEVYFASSCPPIKYPCFFGIDFPSSEELVAFGKTYEEISEALGADEVIYLDTDDLQKAIGVKSVCQACIDQKYPVDISCAKEFANQRLKNRE